MQSPHEVSELRSSSVFRLLRKYFDLDYDGSKRIGKLLQELQGVDSQELLVCLTAMVLVLLQEMFTEELEEEV